MDALLHPGFMRLSCKRFGSERLIALTVVALFSLQCSRFFFAIQLDQFLCYDSNHTHQVGSPEAQDHNHHHEGEATLAHTHDDGFFFQHCKDTYDGIGLTPVQPLGVPVAAGYQPPTAVSMMVRAQDFQPLDQFLPPPFQPPRNLS